MSDKPVIQLSEKTLAAITESRRVLYTGCSGKDYVSQYQQYWAKTYDDDASKLGFKSWEYSAAMISKYLPNKNGKILDYCGGTGKCGKLLQSMGYTNMHITDGSSNMLKQANETKCYEKTFCEIVERGQDIRFLKDANNSYDLVLSSMSLSEYVSTVQQFIFKALKKGGIFVSIESIPHLKKANLDGIPWLLEECKKADGVVELIEDNDNMRHDDFTDDMCKVLVVRKK
jgi:ubiquinone/menaquinone biosynthesis C-methylase UbiE